MRRRSQCAPNSATGYLVTPPPAPRGRSPSCEWPQSIEHVTVRWITTVRDRCLVKIDRLKLVHRETPRRSPFCLLGSTFSFASARRAPNFDQPLSDVPHRPARRNRVEGCRPLRHNGLLVAWADTRGVRRSSDGRRPVTLLSIRPSSSRLVRTPTLPPSEEGIFLGEAMAYPLGEAYARHHSWLRVGERILARHSNSVSGDRSWEPAVSPLPTSATWSREPPAERQGAGKARPIAWCLRVLAGERSGRPRRGTRSSRTGRRGVHLAARE